VGLKVIEVILRERLAERAVKDRRTKAADPELAQRVARECLELGMMTSVVRGGLGIFRIAPPITIEPDEIDRGTGDIRSRPCPGSALKLWISGPSGTSLWY